MIKVFKKNIFIIFGVVVLVYILICDLFVTISLSMNVCFMFAGILLILLHYVTRHPIDLKNREPSFFYILIKVASAFFFSLIFISTLFNIYYPKKGINVNDQKYDYIIVFGAGITPGKNEIINTRLDNAVSYANKYRRCKFVLTGAKGEEEPIAEAVYMQNYMTERGVHDNQIIIDPFSVNTYENIYNSLNLIKKDILRRNARENIITRPFKNEREKFDLDFLNIGFMSSEFHLTRINMMAKKMGIYRPYDITCATRLFYKLYLYVREDLSLFKALVLGQIEF